MTAWTVPAEGRHTSGYGPRNTGIPGASTYHRGHDIAPPVPGQRGVTVHAVGPGRVAAVAYNNGRGRYVRVRHDDGSLTLYQHLDRVDVGFGQRVTTGQRVGLMGDTGVGAGVHLHFECYEAGRNAYILANAVDPVAYLSRRGVRLVPASTVSRPIPVGGHLPTLPDLDLPEDLMAKLDDDDIQRIAQATARAVWNYRMEGGENLQPGNAVVPRETAGERLRQIRRQTQNLRLRTVNIHELVKPRPAVAAAATTEETP